MNNEDYCSNIKHKLARLVAEVKLDSSANLHSINIHAESFFREFLNILYGWNLTNANAANPNTKGIDLLYPAGNIVVQVSSTVTYAKIQSSLEKSTDYPGAHFYFLAISETHPSFRKSFEKHELIFNEETDILDTSLLFSQVVNCGSIKKQKRLSALVDQYFESTSNIRKQNGQEKAEKQLVQRFAIVTVLICLGILSLTAVFALINPDRNSRNQQLGISVQHLSGNADDYLEHKESIQPEFKIDPIKAVMSYNTGVELYNSYHFESAAVQFERAITEQEMITGAGSTEVGIIYYMLGLSRLYAMHILDNSGEDAISALNHAIQIFEKCGDTFKLARCYYQLGIAYFETGGTHLNRAVEQVNHSIQVLKDYHPDEVLMYRISDQDSNSLDYYMNAFCDDYETIYRDRNYFMLLQDNYHLMGKICSRLPDMDETSFYFFNLALDMSANLFAVDYAFALCVSSDRVKIENAEIKEYVEQLDFDSLDKTETIKIYSCEEEDGVIVIDVDQYEQITVCASVDTATLLTNRAMSEDNYGFYILAAEDCMTAFEIWDQIPYSSWGNKSYTYSNMIIAQIGIAVNTDDFKTSLAEKKEELVDYADTAAMLDTDFWGESHIRTAYSYETRGYLFTALEELDTAIKSYEKAAAIYEAAGDEERAQSCRDMVDMIRYAEENEGEIIVKLRPK